MLLGILNALRGKGIIATWVFFVTAGCFISVITINHTEVPLSLHLACCIIGISLWKAPAWNNYMGACLNGRWDRNRTAVKWIDALGYKLVPFVSNSDEKSNRKRGLICMAIRGSVYSAPLFLYLGYVASPPMALLWPLMAMQGVFYWCGQWVKDDFEGGLQTTFAEITSLWFMGDLIVWGL